MVFLVSLVIIGGIKRIGTVTEKIVPFMCGVYLLISLFVLVHFYDRIPGAFASILSGAFTPSAAYGGGMAFQVNQSLNAISSTG